MKRMTIMFCILYFLLSSSGFAQRLWDIQLFESDYGCLGSDTTTEGLKHIIRGRIGLCYSSAQKFLAVREGENARAFLIDSLPSLGYMKNPSLYWSDYFDYQILRGYYGDQGAFSGLDSIIQFGNEGDQFSAISWLTHAGYLEHFNALVNLYNSKIHREDAISLMGHYGKDSRYRSTITNLLTPIIRDSIYIPVNYVATCWNAIYALGEFDSTLLVSLLDERFRREASEVRNMIFDMLKRYDPNQQPERLMWAVSHESDGSIRGRYFPNYFYIESRRYLEPFFIKFMKDWQQNDTSYYVQGDIKRFLKKFMPIVPPLEKSTLELIDSLGSYLIQLGSFNWVSNNNFINELNDYLANAKNNLNAGSQIGCARQIKIFQQAVYREYKDSTNVTPAFVTVEAWKFLYYNAQYILDRLPQIPSEPGWNIKLISSTGTKLPGGALQYYEGSWKDAVNNNDGTFSIASIAKTLSLRMTYEYAAQTKSNVSISSDTIVFQTVNAQLQLQNSSGVLMDTGSVQYYAGAWRTFGTTNNGTANKELLSNNYSFRMTYAYASKDKQQDLSTNPTVLFQTVNAQVQLQNSSDVLMDTGSVQYYSGAWRTFGTTNNGTTNKELLPNNYSFRMTYAYASKDKQQDLSTNPTVLFQTVNAAVQLQNSQGALIDQGTVQYYSGAWRTFGTTNNGTTNKELLPNNYSFRMSYAYASKDKQQDIGTNATVVFQTVSAAVQLQNSQGTLIDQGTVQYYSGAWRDFGTTNNGTTNKELLPNNYSFRMTYAFASKDKQQDLSTNPTVIFQTVNAAVQLKNSLGALIDQGSVQYYSGAWRDFGTTNNGTTNKELLPNNYTFRITHEYISVDKSQDLSANSTVSFSTVLCTLRVSTLTGLLIDNALTSYYSGAWRQIGSTVNGEVTKELLPANLTFRISYNNKQQDKVQNLSTNTVVQFAIQP